MPLVRTPAALRVVSMCTYFAVAILGVRALTLPWAIAPAPAAVAAAWAAGQMYVLQYLAEGLCAMTGRVTMHAWAADEVVKHHLTVGLLMLPPCLLCAAYAPSEWRSAMERHPPAVAMIASACLTGFNEGMFVLRTFLPARLADAPATRWLQSCVTLAVLAQNVPMTQVGCALGGFELVGELRAVASACVDERAYHRCARYRPLLQLALLLAYAAAIGFFWAVQRHYLAPNLRRVLSMSDFEPRARKARPD